MNRQISRRVLFAFAIIGTALAPSLSQAGYTGVSVGDKIKMYNPPPGNNGEFSVHHEDSAADFSVETFRTFCVETTQNFIGDEELRVYGLGLKSDTGGDSLTKAAAWLFRKFAILGGGTFMGIDDGVSVHYNGTNFESNQLQNAFWYYVGGQVAFDGSNKYMSLVEDNMAEINALTVEGDSIAGVQIMNLRLWDDNPNANTTKTQDMLYYDQGLDPKPVPEPMSAALWGTMLVGGLAVRRRRQRRQTAA